MHEWVLIGSNNSYKPVCLYWIGIEEVHGALKTKECVKFNPVLIILRLWLKPLRNWLNCWITVYSWHILFHPTILFVRRKRKGTNWYCSFFLFLGPEMKRFLIFDGSDSIPISCRINPSAPKIRTCTIELTVYYSCGGSACE